MKKYMLLIAASLVASALVTGCGSPAEGNTTTTPSTTTEGTKPTTDAPASTEAAPTTGAAANAPATAPVPEDKK